LAKLPLCPWRTLLATGVRPITQSRQYLWIWTLPASSPVNEHRTPTTSAIPPSARWRMRLSR